jgi:hypothetical protein
LYQILIRAQELGYDRADPLIRNTRSANEELYRKEQIRVGVQAIRAERASGRTADADPASIITRLRLAFGRG